LNLTLRTTLVLLAITAASSGYALAAAPSPVTSMEAYQRAQDLREEADKIVGEAPTSGDLKQAAEKLQEALDYLARPEIRELATGNIFLYARNHDVLRDLAGVYALMGEKEKALRLLELMQQEAWVPAVAKWLADDAHFATLRDEPRYQAVLATMTATERLWSTPAIATPYKDKLTVEERIAGLSLFWAEARQNFVYFDHVPQLEWDRVYLKFLPQVMAAESTEDYYRVLMRLAPLLRDSHTNIYPPEELRGKFYGRPPLRTERLQGKVYVTAVRSTSLATHVKVGDELVEIDGLDVDRYAEERVAPGVSSSTPQDRMLRMYTYQLLLGDQAKPVSLRLRDAEGHERIEVVNRQGYTDVVRLPQFEFRMLPDGLAYLALDHFESDEGVKAFEAALPQILTAKGLILDLRRNGGGSSAYGLAILSYLIPAPIASAKSRIRGESGLDRARSGPAGRIGWKPVPDDGQLYEKQHKDHYAGPVVVLVGAQTFSAAEDFVMSFDNMKRGLLIGSPTAGSTGQPMTFRLPGGGMARICVKRDTYPDGREFVGVGIAPQKRVDLTAQALRSGRDPVLERAILELATP
jgi:carboxyl-terminal processing protease